MDLKKFAFLGFGKPKEQFPIRSFNDFPVPIPREVMNQWEREAKSRNLDDYAKANNFFAEKFNPWLETPAGKAWNKKQADVFNRQKGKTAMDLKKFAQEKIAKISPDAILGLLTRGMISRTQKMKMIGRHSPESTHKQLHRVIDKLISRGRAPSPGASKEMLKLRDLGEKRTPWNVRMKDIEHQLSFPKHLRSDKV